MKAALIMPALDEEKAIGIALGRVPPGVYAEIIVADNGSTDWTAEIARGSGARVVFEAERGYGAACQCAIAALSRDTEVVVFMDADASDDPADVFRLIAPIAAGDADLVIGSRTLGHAEEGALLPHQRLGNCLATWLIRLAFGFSYTDLGPFRAIRRESLTKLGMCNRNYGWTIEMQVKALRCGLRVVEVPVSYRKRIGRSKVSGNLTASVVCGVKILYTFFRLAASSSAR